MVEGEVLILGGGYEDDESWLAVSYGPEGNLCTQAICYWRDCVDLETGVYRCSALPLYD